MLSSCSPRVIEHIRYQHDTTYVEKVQIDSIYKRDSVYVKEKGDTIYIYKEKIRDRYRFIHDTTRVVRVDSVTVERIKEVKVEKELSWWQRSKIGAFPWLFGAVVLLLIWTFRKQILKLIKIFI
jgi:hypothetical protein